MAEILNTFGTPAKPTGRPPKYPWTEWFDGQIRMIRRGRDFRCTLKTMDKLVRHAAARRGFRVTVLRSGNGLKIGPRISPKENPAAGG